MGSQSRTWLSDWTELNSEQGWASFHVFISHLYVFFMEKFLFRSSTHFFIGLLIFLMLSCISCLYILEINPVSCFICNYFLPFCWLCFVYCFLICAEEHLSSNCLFLFYFHCSRRWVKEDVAVIYVKNILPMFSFKSLIVSDLTFWPFFSPFWDYSCVWY